MCIVGVLLGVLLVFAIVPISVNSAYSLDFRNLPEKSSALVHKTINPKKSPINALGWVKVSAYAVSDTIFVVSGAYSVTAENACRGMSKYTVTVTFVSTVGKRVTTADMYGCSNLFEIPITDLTTTEADNATLLFVNIEDKRSKITTGTFIKWIL